MEQVDTRQFYNSKRILDMTNQLSELIQAHSDELAMSRLVEYLSIETDRSTAILYSLL